MKLTRFAPPASAHEGVFVNLARSAWSHLCLLLSIWGRSDRRDTHVKCCYNICRQQAALRHDLMGRIYHWLLHDAKFLGTYYTSVSAATLLLKIALSLEWKYDFTTPRALADFK